MEEYNAEVIPEILSTHPANETRAMDLDNLIPAVN
jgi:predicted Zn-dependent protease